MKKDLKFAMLAVIACGAFGYSMDKYISPRLSVEYGANNEVCEVITDSTTIEVEEELLPIYVEPKITKGCYYKVSRKGKNFIKQMEQCSLVAYWDTNGYSIGYGHHTAEVYEGMEITQEQADKWFEEDVAWVEKAVNRYLKSLPYEYEFPQSFVDGLASFIYNCGEGGAKNSLFYERLTKCRVKNGLMDANDYHFTLASIKTSKISCKAHERRRYKEYQLMLAKI